MSMIRLAFLNFKNSFRNYLTLVISLAFTILVLFNFQNLIVSGAFETLGTRNREYVEIIIQVISFVLVCFMFCSSPGGSGRSGSMCLWGFPMRRSEGCIWQRCV